MNTYVSFYDLDHSLISASSGTLIIKDLYQRGVFPFRYLLKGLFLSSVYRFGFIDTESLIKKWVKKLAGMPYATIEHYADLFFEQTIKNYVRQQALESIYFHRKNGAIIALLSASLDFICKPIKKHLLFDSILCTELEINDGLYTGSIKGSYCYGKEKLHRAISFCKKHNLDLKQAYYYADSVADIPLLETVGFPQCVSPHPKLLKIARAKGWAVHFW